MGYWLQRKGSTEWVEGTPDEALLAKTGTQEWYSSWKPSMLNHKVDVYRSAGKLVQGDLERLRKIQRDVKGRQWDLLSHVIGNGLQHYDGKLVEVVHKEVRDEAVVAFLQWPEKFLYRIPYKSNDPDEKIRLSYLLHEFTHVDADQRYRYHSATASIRDFICLNANGDPHDENRDQRLVQERLDELGRNHAELVQCIATVSDTTLKAHLERRQGRAQVLYNEWDSVMTELALFLYLYDSSMSFFNTPIVKLVRKFATDAYQHRGKHPPRRRTPRPGGIN
jgi:hypothetical protein